MPNIPSFGSAARRAVVASKTQYFGIALLLAWHYCLWFVPNSISFLGIMSPNTTRAWLMTLACTAASMLVIPQIFQRRSKKHLSDYRWISYVSPVVLSVCTLLFCLTDSSSNTFLPSAAILAIFFGLSSSSLWILWSERYACKRAAFQIRNVAPVFATVILLALLASSLLPPLFSATLVAALPLLSSAIYLVENHKNPASHYPNLFSNSHRKKTLKSVSVVCSVGLALTITCSFVAAIVPTLILGTNDEGYQLTWILATGITAIGIAVTLYALACRGENPHTALPFLVACGIVAVALFLRGSPASAFASYALSMGACAMTEILLLTYFGSLSSKGYVLPALAFGLAGGISRLGVFVGDGAAIALRQYGPTVEDIIQLLCLASICLLGFLLIPLLRQEYAIVELSNAPLTDTELDALYASIVEEFDLSCRESEVMRLLALNCSVEHISKKLIISPYTVQTHVRHIYRKMDVHKRSELIDCVNQHIGRS